MRDIHRSSVQLLEETTLDKEDKDRYARTFPPNTSSPIIRHAAVWMARVFRSSAEAIMLDVRPLVLGVEVPAVAAADT